MSVGLFYDGDRKFAAIQDPEERRTVEGLRLAADILNAEPDFWYFGGPVTGGTAALELARQRGFGSIADVRENLSNEEFYKQVVRPNFVALARREAVYRRGDPALKSINPVDLEGKYRGITGGESFDNRMTETGFMAFWLPILNRLVGAFAVPDGWETSNGTTEEVTEATMIQAGLRDRTPEFHLESYHDDPAQRAPLSLNARIRALGEMFAHKLDAGVDAPAQATALARLFHVHDMIQNNALGVIDSALLHDYDAADIERMKKQWKPRLLEEAAATITLDGLAEEYADAAQKAAPSPNKPSAAPNKTNKPQPV